MQPMTHPDPLYQEEDSATPSAAKTSFPLHWYIFFGILEPFSVLGGVVYAVFLQEKCFAEMIPAGYLNKIAPSTVTGAAQRGARSFWKVATQESTGFNVDAVAALATPSDTSKMVLAQLGSCYFLIFLNSALMLYMIRKHLSYNPVVQEQVLYAFFFVLGAADWTHILLTIHNLPSASKYSSASFLTKFAAKLVTLTDYRAWNSLLFGNILITLILFTFRAAWWMGIARDSFVAESAASVLAPTPAAASDKQKLKKQ